MKAAPEKKRNLFERQRVVAVQGAAFTMPPFFSGIGTGCHRDTAAVALSGRNLIPAPKKWLTPGPSFLGSSNYGHR